MTNKIKKLIKMRCRKVFGVLSEIIVYGTIDVIFVRIENAIEKRANKHHAN